MSETTKKVSGIPENEGFWQKAKRKTRTAVNWGKTHWKGIALGAVAIGGGAYMLSRRGNNEDDDNQVGYIPASGGVDYREAIDRAFTPGEEDGSGVGPEDDEPDEAEY